MTPGRLNQAINPEIMTRELGCNFLVLHDEKDFNLEVVTGGLRDENHIHWIIKREIKES